jgi:DNA repair exonuclease SbcCD nuclease subunit
VNIIAFGDTHIRSSAENNADRLAAWDRAIEIGLANQVDLWCHLGDVFDEGSSIEDRLQVAERLSRMAEAAPVEVLEGNHDKEGDLGIFWRLRTKYPVRVHRLARVAARTTALKEEARFFVLPYPRKSGLLLQGYAPHEVAGAADGILDVLFAQAAMELRQAEAGGLPTFAIGHATIAGSMTSTGQPMIGRDIAVSPVHLARLGKAPIFFGHIHKPQEIHGAHYAGSLCRLSYGETEEKRLLLAQSYPGAAGWRISSLPVFSPPRYHVEAHLSRAGFVYEVRRGPDGPLDAQPASWQGCDIRVRVRYPEQERDVLQAKLSKPEIAKYFEGARNLDIEPIAVHQNELRAPEVIAASTLEEKLAAWARLSGVEWSEALQARAAELLAASDPQALVDAQRERLSQKKETEREAASA